MRFVYAFVPAVASLYAADANVQQIVHQALEARGGAAKFANVRSLKANGRIQFAQGEFQPLTMMAKRPSFFRVDIGGNIVQGYDGKTAWQSNGAGTAEVSDAQKSQIVDQAMNAIGGPLVDWRQRAR